MRILFAGRSQLPTINIAAGYLKHCDPDVSIDVLDPFLPTKGDFVPEDVRLYDNVLQSPEIDFRAGSRIRKVFRAIHAAVSSPCALAKRFRAEGMAGAKQHLYALAASHVRRQWYRRAFADYDAVHIHGLFENTFAQIFPDNFREAQRVVVSFWGSDLFRHAGVETYRQQYEILHRADAITIGSPEMREIVLSKFGRDLESRCHQANFGLPDDTLEFLEAADRGAARARITELLGAPAERVWVKLGYSNDRAQKYVEIVGVLDSLPDRIKERLHFLVPMTYGAGGTAHVADVAMALREAGLSGTVISEYMAKEDMLRLSVACEVMANLRTTDGFNNAMCESLLAGRIVMNGSWLPYGILRTQGVRVVDVPTIADAARCLQEVCEDLEGLGEQCASNPGRMKELVAAESVASKWMGLYR